MARMRWVKPEFWTDPDIADLSPEQRSALARLLLEGE